MRAIIVAFSLACAMPLVFSCQTTRCISPCGESAAGGAPAGRAPKGYALVTAGTFKIGMEESKFSKYPDLYAARKPREVQLTRAFYIKTTEVTQGEWKAVMGGNPSYFLECGDTCPVERVSFYEAVEYLNRLSEREGLERCYDVSGCKGQLNRGCADMPGIEEAGGDRSGVGAQCDSSYTCERIVWKGLECNGYRLPTDTEWEVAARAGDRRDTYNGDITEESSGYAPQLDPVGVYVGDQKARYKGAWKHCAVPGQRCGTRAVASKKPNALGLYDMYGNVWEWVWDIEALGVCEERVDPVWGGLTLDATDETYHPYGKGRVMQSRRTWRGGGWYSEASRLTAPYRYGTKANDTSFATGFRPVRTVTP